MGPWGHGAMGGHGGPWGHGGHPAPSRVQHPAGCSTQHNAAPSTMQHPVGKAKDIQNLRDLELKNKVIWLQLLSASKKATNLCIIETAIENNWNVSIQTHKFVEIR